MLCALFSFDVGSSFQGQIVQEVAAKRNYTKPA